MNLLEKMDAIDVKADTRISGADRYFCETHQRAFDAAHRDLLALWKSWKTIEMQQREILEAAESSHYAYEAYINLSGFSCSAITEKLESLPSIFISRLVEHFNSAYHVSVSSTDIEEILLPQKPESYGRNEEALKQYHKKLQMLPLRYEDVVEKIFVQLGGRTFTERALDELKERCHKGAWNSYGRTASYTVKGNIISFSYGCRHENWFGHETWKLTDAMKDVLCGIAHFELGAFEVYPPGFSELVGWNDLECSVYEYTTCSKFQQLKMFKNGRLDLKFTSKALAEQFTSEYLGLVY